MMTKLVIEWERSKGCVICKNNDLDVIQFHHVNPGDKKFNISRSWQRYGIEKVREEMAKCVTLCANCHMKVHAGTLEIPEEFL